MKEEGTNGRKGERADDRTEERKNGRPKGPKLIIGC
jgi:hypothetical protein